MGFKLSAKAAEDIKNIWQYTFENGSLEQADRYINQNFDEIEYLASDPTGAKDFSHVRKNYRCSKVKSHIIFYRHGEKLSDIEVTRVLHERMDIESRIAD